MRVSASPRAQLPGQLRHPGLAGSRRHRIPRAPQVHRAGRPACVCVCSRPPMRSAASSTVHPHDRWRLSWSPRQPGRRSPAPADHAAAAAAAAAGGGAGAESPEIGLGKVGGCKARRRLAAWIRVAIRFHGMGRVHGIRKGRVTRCSRPAGPRISQRQPAGQVGAMRSGGRLGCRWLHLRESKAPGPPAWRVVSHGRRGSHGIEG